MTKVLFVTSERKDVRELYHKAFDFWKVSGASAQDNALLQISEGRYDLVFLDLAMTGLYAPDLLRRISALPEHPPVFILSREYSFPFLDFSSRYGIAGYFHMPYSIRSLVTSVDRYFEASDRNRDGSAVSDPGFCGTYGTVGHSDYIGETRGADCASDSRVKVGEADARDSIFRCILGKSRQMETLRAAILSLSSRMEPVLISGETGTGKDLVSRLIHRLSPVSAGPYSAFNVSCIPQTLAESLLFGTRRGSYTDAADSSGLFERADKGTLFLDEIGELELSLQPKLLRVLETGEVTRLGSPRCLKINFRLLCATNRNLTAAVSEGRFRADLFHRIDVLRIHIPPLREHPEDIPVLAASVLPGYKKALSAGALDKLQLHDWPGNVRDLFNCLGRAACNCNSDIIQPEQIQF